MTDDARDFLFELLETPSPTGFELDGQRVWAGYLSEAADRIETNTYGSTFAVLEGRDGEEAPRLMLDAHADEIGMMVSHITDEGFLHVKPIGGSDRKISQARRVRVLTENGPIPGVTGHTAIHLRDRDDDSVPKWEDLYIDIGVADKEAVHERGVRVGLPVVSAEGPEMITGTRLVGRALDNRLGGFVIAETLRRLSEEGDRPAATIVAANSVQEEIGGYGAAMTAYTLEPDVALAFDVTHATDTPGLNQAKHGQVKMGEGPSITHGTSTHPLVVERLMEVADREDLPLQHEASSRRTGTDTDAIFRQRGGVPSALMSVPLRYMHSMSELVDLDDLEQCVRLQVAFARSLTGGDSFRAAL